MGFVTAYFFEGAIAPGGAYMFYVVHVVRKYVTGFGMADQEGEWLLERFEDLTIASGRCSQLNRNIKLEGAHWYEVRENVEGLQKSKLCDF